MTQQHPDYGLSSCHLIQIPVNTDQTRGPSDWSHTGYCVTPGTYFVTCIIHSKFLDNGWIKQWGEQMLLGVSAVSCVTIMSPEPFKTMLWAWVESGVTNIDSELPQWNYSCSKLKILWRSVSMINNNKCAMNTTVDMAFNVNLKLKSSCNSVYWIGDFFLQFFLYVYITIGWGHLLVLACAVIDLWQTLQLPPYQICHNLIAPANYD